MSGEKKVQKHYEGVKPDDTTRDMAFQLIHGLPLEKIPKSLHPALLSPLAVYRNEAKLSKNERMIQKIDGIIWSLKLTPIDPPNKLSITAERETWSTRSISSPNNFDQAQGTVPLISCLTSRSTTADVQVRCAKSEVAAAEKYWREEEARFYELKQNAYKEFHKNEIVALRSARNPAQAEQIKLDLEYDYNSMDQAWRKKKLELEREKRIEICNLKQTVNNCTARTMNFPTEYEPKAKTSRIPAKTFPF